MADSTGSPSEQDRGIPRASNRHDGLSRDARHPAVVPPGHAAGGVPGEGQRLEEPRVVYVPPERGRIFDAEGRVVADNRQVKTISSTGRRSARRRSATRSSSASPDPLQETVGDLQRRDARASAHRRIPSAPRARSTARCCHCPSRRTSTRRPSTSSWSAARTIPASPSSEEWKRVYPYAPLASHVIGYIGRDHRGHLDGVPRPRATTATSASASSASSGAWSRCCTARGARGLRDRRGRRDRPRADFDQGVDPVAGKDVQLTIDLDVQQYAEQALQTELPTGRTCRRATGEPERRGRRRTDGAQPDRSDDEPKSRSTPARRSGTPRVRPVQGSRRVGRRRGLPHRPDRGDGQLPDVRQPLAGLGHRRRSTRSCSR